MATCPSCSAMIEADAQGCWHCGAALTDEMSATTASGAATLLAPGVDPPTRTSFVDAMIGRELIGQYVIRAKLGEGGMGEVYLADQPTVGREVAIKIVHGQARGREHDDHIERFRNEAKAAASLAGAHIVKIFNWGELEDGTSFMAMEYLRGATLAELLRERGALEPAAAVAIATQICTALSEAHAAGIVHRDLKPSNVMLIPRGDEDELSFVKVLDFGVAKLEGADITRSGAMFGTPQYMSPEQLRAGKLDGRSDLYSLGVMLFELLAGQLPFSAPTAIGYVTAHLHDEPPALPRRLPRALAEVVTMLMAKDPDERPPDAASAARALEDALAGRSPTAVRRRARRRALRRALVSTLALAAVGGLGYGGWWLYQSRTAAEEALVQERARSEALDQRVREQQAAVERARTEAQATADVQLREMSKAREQRREVLAAGKLSAPSKLDAKTRALLTRSRSQLEIQLAKTLDGRRIPPSEVEDVRRVQALAVAAFQAGEISEDDLREQLVSMILLYRKTFEPMGRGDAQALAELEAAFMTMQTGDELDRAERQALLDAIHEAHDGREMSAEDRDYFKRLAVAKMIRDRELSEAQKDELESTEDHGPGLPVGALPSVEDEPAAGSGPDAPLPSLEGM